MLELTTKQTLAKHAETIAKSYNLIQCGGLTYAPAHWLTEELGPCDPTEQVCFPLDRLTKRKLGNHLGKILFATDSEVTNFDFMLQQFAEEWEMQSSTLLIKTKEGLRCLTESGDLVPADGTFNPNYLKTTLNNDSADKQFVMDTIVEWLNSEEEAVSLLRHLSTALSPSYSAVKYLLLIGDGRNGKSVLLSMLLDLFGSTNVSHITRQQMAERLQVCTELNGKLLNIIFDGEQAYIKDSSMEKTLIAGEPAQVRLLYENGTTRVQTNALFIEAVNREPKTRDKSGALQKRLARFSFPNVYPLNKKFERKLRSERYLGALLSLLLDNFVTQEQLAEALKPTTGSVELRLDQEMINSPVLQFVQYLVLREPAWMKKLEAGGLPLDALIDSFMAWRLEEGFNELSTLDAQRMFRENFFAERKSIRDNGRVVKKWILKAPQQSVQELLDQLKGDENAPTESLVDD